MDHNFLVGEGAPADNFLYLYGALRCSDKDLFANLVMVLGSLWGYFVIMDLGLDRL